MLGSIEKEPEKLPSKAIPKYSSLDLNPSPSMSAIDIEPLNEGSSIGSSIINCSSIASTPRVRAFEADSLPEAVLEMKRSNRSSSPSSSVSTL